MKSKITQATDSSSCERVSDSDVGVSGTASAPELNTTAQKLMIEEVQNREDSSSLALQNLINWSIV